MGRAHRSIRSAGAIASACVSLALSAATLLGIAALAPMAAAAAPVLTEFCTNGQEGGRCQGPRGIAVDPVSGDVYVADGANTNNRIQKFTAWGEFLRAWGWDVVASGPGDDVTAPEDQFEVCVPANGDVCKGGLLGGEVGQFSGPHGLAVDFEGDLYVVDRNNRRVQKFDSEGNFLLMFGGEVNKTKSEEPGSTEAERNLCTAASGDVCQAGVEGTGDGQFGDWAVGSFIAASPDGQTIYVGDEGRIQEFDTGGNHTGDLPDPDGLLAANTVKSLAVDPGGGDLYVALLAPTANVHRLDPQTGEGIDELEVSDPTAVAVDTQGHVYVFHDAPGSNETDPGSLILEFDAAGKLVEVIDQNKSLTVKDRFTAASTGLATSSACGIEGTDLYVSNPAPASNSFVRLYGPPPQDFDPPCSPPPLEPPAISDQYAVSVGAAGATVRAEIDPLFWDDTRYYVQYGTGKCSEGGCESTQPLPPGKLLTDSVLKATLTTSGVSLSDLEPATTYRYRFVAESTGGGPVLGVGATAGDPEGAEGTFTTYPPLPKAKVDCPNQEFRTGFSAPLANCRAYELVSPLDKNNGDIATDDAFGLNEGANFQLASPDGDRATYASFTAFSGSQASPLLSQYLSSRDPQTGWSTHSISPPRSSVPFYGPAAAPNFSQFKAFTPDLCKGWFIQDTNFTLDPAQTPGVANIYRRDDPLCGAEGYGLLTPVAPTGFPRTEELEEGESAYFPTLQGVSTNGQNTLLRVNAAMATDACRVTIPENEVVEGSGIFQVYLHTAGEEEIQVVSVLPSGEPACVHSSGGTSQGLTGHFREDNVHHALSEDGSRVFWSTSAKTTNQDPPHFSGGGSGDQPGPLFVRLNPTEPPSAQALGAATGSGTLNKPPAKVITGVSTASGAFAVGQDIAGKGIPAGTTIAAVGATTITLSASATVSEPTPASFEAWSDCTEPEKACTVQISSAPDTRFWGADPQGATAIYSAAGGLFEYAVATDTSTTIAANGLEGVMGMSEDAGRVYFSSSAVLSGEQENSEGEKALAGRPNLYLHERGESPVFVGTLSDLDTQQGGVEPIATRPKLRIARVSADGMHAAFVSAASLTGYDNTDLASGQPDGEVFLYDAAPGEAGELRCVSCNPSGALPQGRLIGGNYRAAARLPGWESQLYPNRALLDSGDRLFFESFEGLVLRDTNGVRDVYEWQRAAGKEECEEAGAELFVDSAGGCLSLISSGKSSIGSEFIDASASGSDVFLMSAASLLPHDFGLIDVYDAREGGGLPPPPTPKPPCEGEACQPAPPAPQPPTPASSNFEGKGNVIAGKPRRRCGKGKQRVKRAGKARCVKKHRCGKGKQRVKRAGKARCVKKQKRHSRKGRASR